MYRLNLTSGSSRALAPTHSVFWPGGLHGLYGPWGIRVGLTSDLHFHFAHTNPHNASTVYACLRECISHSPCLQRSYLRYYLRSSPMNSFPDTPTQDFSKESYYIRATRVPWGLGQLCYAITAILCLGSRFLHFTSIFIITSTLSTVHKFPLSNSYRDLYSVLNIIKVDYHRLDSLILKQCLLFLREKNEALSILGLSLCWNSCRNFSQILESVWFCIQSGTQG